MESLPKENLPHLLHPPHNLIQGRKLHNRLAALLAHTTRYAFQGQSRLAADAGVSKAAVCRLMSGHSSPSFALVSLLAQALEKQLGRALDPREIVSLDGSYPTPSVCALMQCRGCLPAEAYDAQDNLKPEYKEVKPGQWSVSDSVVGQAIAPQQPKQFENSQAQNQENKSQMNGTKERL